MYQERSVFKIGRYIRQKGGYSAFQPSPFPPQGLSTFSPRLHLLHEDAARLVGKLDGISRLLPDKEYFLRMFIQKDAALSSQIEGTQATLQDAVVAPVVETRANLPADVDDILHYIDAVHFSATLKDTLPFSWRFIRQIHGRMMSGARSTQHAYPGEFRTTQNWIGGRSPLDATFIPPAVPDMLNALHDLEKFIYAEDEFPRLFKAGLIHAQFETIHPFVDGNGRTGRILIALYLCFAGLLELPVLYLSAYFKKYQKMYYQKLEMYHSEKGEIESWLTFFLEGVIETAQSSIETCAAITDIRDRDFGKVQQLGARSAPAALTVVRQLFSQPIIGVAEIVKWTGYSRAGSHKFIKTLIDLGVLVPLGSAKYGQKYVYSDYYALFDDSFRQPLK